MTLANIKDKLFNIDLIISLGEKKKLLNPVKSLQIFEPSSNIFKSDGLFSLEIFGSIGSEIRNKTLSYTPINIGILHPLVYHNYVSLRGLYGDILAGKAYVTFDKNIKDFVLTKKEEGGQTGFHYFVSNMDNIVFTDKKSEARKYKIKLIEKYGKSDNLLTDWLILPAGLRDYTVSADGRPSEDEINTLYRKLISTANMLNNTIVSESNYQMFDVIRFKLQRCVNDIYNYILNLLDGKSKFIQSKWSKRAVTDGTRNVITSTPVHITDLKSKNKVTSNHTVIGLYQFVKGIRPITIYQIQSKFISKIFNQFSTLAYLVNPTTLKYEETEVDLKDRDEWLSGDGVNNIMNKLKSTDVLISPVKIGGKYLLLVYDDGDNIKIIYHNTDTSNLNNEYIRPITYGELFYLAVEDISDKYPGFLTRYPVIGLGSIYPSKSYLKTTIHGRKVNYENMLLVKELYEYPNFKSDWVKSVQPHVTKLANLDADFDGDTVSYNIIQTEEAIKEIDDMFNSVTFYLNPDNSMVNSASNDVSELVMGYMTEDKNERY